MKESKIIGASLGGFNSLTLEKAMVLYLKLSNDFDLNAVEIRFEKERGRPSLWSWETNSEVVNFLDNLEVKGAHLPFVYLNPISLNPKIRKGSMNQLKDAIEKASELGMSYTVMHARGFAYGLTQEQQIEEWKKAVKELTEYAGDNSILLTLENADFLSNLKDIVSVVKEVKSKWLKITLDVGHAHLRSVPPLSTYPLKALMLRGLDLFFPFFIKTNMPYEEYSSLKNFIKSEHDLISNVHVHDYNGRRDHIAIGEGKIDFSFLPILGEKGFKGPFILEVEFENCYEDFLKNYKRLYKLINRRKIW